MKVHDLLGILEEEEVLELDHPAYAQIRDRVESLRLMALAHASAPLTSGSAQDKLRLQQYKKRKRDELFPSYNLGPYPQDMQGSEQYQQMAVNYYHQMQLMQQQQVQQQHIPPHMPRKKMRKGAVGSVNDRSVISPHLQSIMSDLFDDILHGSTLRDGPSSRDLFLDG